MSPRKASESSDVTAKKTTIIHSDADVSRPLKYSHKTKIMKKNQEGAEIKTSWSKSSDDVSSSRKSFSHEKNIKYPNEEVKKESKLKKFFTNKINPFKSKQINIEEDDNEMISDSSSTLVPPNKIAAGSKMCYPTKSDPLQHCEWQEQPKLREKNIKKGSHIEFHRKSVTKVNDLLAALNVQEGGDQSELLKHFLAPGLVENISRVSKSTVQDDFNVSQAGEDSFF